MNVADCLNSLIDCKDDPGLKLNLPLKGDCGKVPLPVTISMNLENGFIKRDHKRAGSTGTTSTATSESFTTTDDEADIEIQLLNIHNQIESATTTINQIFNAPTTSETEPNTVISPTNSNNSDYSDLETDLFEDQTFDELNKLRIELKAARESIQLKDEELERLCKIRQDVASELEDLTASLFQEAHNMVRVANEKQATAEKALKESELKVDLFSAEVIALKTLVLTSTPSAPNKHLHPQIDQPSVHRHRRCSSTSHFNLNYGRESSPPDSQQHQNHSPSKDKLKLQHSLNTNIRGCQQLQQQFAPNNLHSNTLNDGVMEMLEVDPVLYEEFIEWRKNVSLQRDENAFMRRIYKEDLSLCLMFANEELSTKVIQAVENGSILIEAIGDKSKTMFPRRCALLEVQRQCHYRMNTGAGVNPDPDPDPDPSAESNSNDTWHFISMICRNRIIAVCDFLNYLKYIERGLVKSTVHDTYWEIVKLRKDMVIARLGLPPNSSH